MNNQEPLEFESANSEDSDEDFFPQHERLDSFIDSLRNYIFRGLKSSESDSIEDRDLSFRIAEFAEEFITAFRQNFSNPESIENSVALSVCFDDATSEKGAMGLANYISEQSFPHFEQNPDDPDTLIRIDEDGTRTVGQFQGREFVPHQ